MRAGAWNCRRHGRGPAHTHAIALAEAEIAAKRYLPPLDRERARRARVACLAAGPN